MHVQQSVFQYNHQDGTLHLPFSNPGTSPVALSEITAHNRKFPQLKQVCRIASEYSPQRFDGIHQIEGAC